MELQSQLDLKVLKIIQNRHSYSAELKPGGQLYKALHQFLITILC